MPDILSIQSTNSTLKLLHPNGSDLGLSLFVLPPDAAEIKRYVQSERNRMLKNAQKRRAPTAQDEERISKEFAMIAVTGWQWTDKDASINGEQPDFSKDTLSELIEHEWLRNQIDEHVGELQNFFPK